VVSLAERAGLALLHRLDPKRRMACRSARCAGMVPLPGPVSARLATTLAGMDAANPVGLAAGYDKNAVALAPLSARVSAFWRWGPPRRARNPATRARACSA
jgi:dihydroorotate dehydrogenase